MKEQRTKISRKYEVGSSKRKILSFLLLTSYFLLLTLNVSAVTLDEKYKPLYNDLSDKFMCLCGCGSTVKTCPHEECGFAIPFKKELSERIQKGETREQIIKYFIDKHGEKILSAPTKKGFNLMAWITPFAAIIVAGFLIKKVINKWTERSGRESAVGSRTGVPPVKESEIVDDKYKKMLKKELEEFE